MESNFESVKVVPGYHPISLMLIKILETGKVGDVLTDGLLGDKINMSTSVGHNGYQYLCSAIRYCLDKKGIVWQRIRGGNAIKCLNPEEVCASSQSDLTHIRKKAKRSAKKIYSVDPKDIPIQERTKFGAMAAQLCTIAHFASNNATKKLVDKGASEPLRIEDTLSLFKVA